jgi:cell division protease FtsH
MVANYGMSQSLGPSFYEYQSEHAFLGQRIATDAHASDATVAVIERESREVLMSALAEARDLLTMHREALDRMIHALLERETLEQAELVELFEPCLDAAAE